MRKSLSLLIVFLFILQALTAQNNDESEFKRFGFKAGANFSHINFARGSPPVAIETTWNTGINFGFLILVPLNDRFFIQPEYLYSQMGGKEKNSNTVYKFNYFSMPVFLKYQLLEKLSLLAGPQFDLLLHVKKTINGSSSDITHDTEERSLALTAGIEYQLIQSLSVCARYMHGLNHIGIGQRSDIQEFKYEMLQLTVCVKF
jgi:hypothetical protein